jgi:molybdate transport system substrate-binding protein
MSKLMRLWLLVVLQIVCGAAHAEGIRVLSGGAARGFVEPLAKTFAQPVKIEYQPMGRLLQSIGPGVDMVIVTSEVLEKLQFANGTPLARTGIGVAVHESAPLPDISTPEALRRTLLAAKSVVHIDPRTGSSGKYVVEAFRKLGIENEMKAKTTLVEQGYAVAPVGRGEVEIGIHQISEILPVKGARLVGPLPPELQKYTVYVGVPVPGTPNLRAVSEFIRHLTSAEARGSLAAAGYTVPE